MEEKKVIVREGVGCLGKRSDKFDKGGFVGLQVRP